MNGKWTWHPDAETTDVRLEIDGDLQVTGWDRPEIEVETDAQEPVTNQSGPIFSVKSQSNCRVRLPMGLSARVDCGSDCIIENMNAPIKVTHIGGDLTLRDVAVVNMAEITGDLSVLTARNVVSGEEVHGDANFQDVGGVNLSQVHGDLRVQGAHGPLNVRLAAGDADLREVTGPIVFKNVAGDLRIADCRGEISAAVNGDAALRNVNGQAIRVTAGGDIRCHLADGAGIRAKIVCSGELRTQGNGSSVVHRGGVFAFETGDGETTVALESGGDVILTGVSLSDEDLASVTSIDEELAGLGEELGKMGAELSVELSKLGTEIADKVNRQLRKKLSMSLSRMGKRAARGKRRRKSWTVERESWFEQPRSETGFTVNEADEPEDEPVTDEERMLILRMVEEGKISAAEAERLLAALGDVEEME